jgi:hypothetical protein
MAQDRQGKLDDADSSASEEEQEVGSSEEVEGSESEEEDESKISPPVIKKPDSVPDPNPDSSDESGSEPESDAEVDPEIKPIASKPMQKARSKPAVGVKRLAEIETGGSKRAKKTTAAADDSKKQNFRLWSEDDEIVILKGLIDYRLKKNIDPVADMNAFHDFIKKYLHIDVSKTQLSDKIRRLRKKYETNAVKDKKGKEPTFAKPHEQKAYDFSKKIWGNDSGTEKKNQTLKVKEPLIVPCKLAKMEKKPLLQKEVLQLEGEKKNATHSQSTQLNSRTIEAPLGVELIIKDRLDLIDELKKTELDEKWKKLHVEEVELYLKRVELIQEQTKLVLESLKSDAK